MQSSPLPQKEVAIRLALGAPRYRIISMQVMEGLLISILGAILGCLLAGWAAGALAVFDSGTLRIPLERAASVLDLRVLVFAAVAAVVAGAISSLAPALRYSRSQLALMIQGETRVVRAGTRRVSLQSLLVVMQIASSVILLVGAGLLVRTLWQLSRVHLGFNPEHTVTASTDPVRQGYSKPAALATLDPLLESLRAQPGVKYAAIGPIPFSGWAATAVSMEGHPFTGKADDYVNLAAVTPDYFETLGIPVVEGRDFKNSDNHDRAGVALINQSIARTYWPHESAVGKHIGHVGPRNDGFEIIGVAGDVVRADIRGAPSAIVYIPMAQAYLMFPWQPDITLLARGTGDPQALIPAMRNAISTVDPGLPMFHVRTMTEVVESALSEERFLGRLLLVVAILAIVLSAAGVYGLVSYTTERATHEFGIRLALGAQQHDVLWMVLRRSLSLAIFGVVMGTAAALWLTKFLTSVLYEVSRTDPITFTAVSLLMIGATMLACYRPARRATRVDPLIALRSE